MIEQGCDQNGEGRDGCGRPTCRKCYPSTSVPKVCDPTGNERCGLTYCRVCYPNPSVQDVAKSATTPFVVIPMLLWCPMCSARHVDKGEFATKPHHTHACQECGMVWRPALVHTVGVLHLPGFKDPGPEST